jgi:DNA-binding response OmpR family regulator
MPGGGTILLVEDEEDIAALVRAYLERDGFRVLWATRGTEGLVELERNDVRLAILDLQLPDADGLDICRAIRASSSLPVVMLTARDEEVDRVTGLELGADDYVTKPFSPRELAARVRSVLRRSRPAPSPGGERLSFGDVELDRVTRDARKRGAEIRLTAKEFDLLWVLASHPRRVFSREQLMTSVWGYTAALDTGTVTVHIRRLREKIEDEPSKPVHLETLWGVGYRLTP